MSATCAIRDLRRWLSVLLLGCAFLLAVLPVRAAPPATVLVWGDSLSAAYGIDLASGWVSLLDQRLQKQAAGLRVVNGSVSGETTAGGLARLPAALGRERPAWLLLELGANDGLRGLPLPAMRENLRSMIRLARAAGAKPVLFEMKLPANYGPVVNKRFQAVFGEVAELEQVPMVPLFLAPLGSDPGRWFQDDGLHPNAAAQPLLLDAAWSTLGPLLTGRGAASRSPAAP